MDSGSDGLEFRVELSFPGSSEIDGRMMSGSWWALSEPRGFAGLQTVIINMDLEGLLGFLVLHAHISIRHPTACWVTASNLRRLTNTLKPTHTPNPNPACLNTTLV